MNHTWRPPVKHRANFARFCASTLVFLPSKVKEQYSELAAMDLISCTVLPCIPPVPFLMSSTTSLQSEATKIFEMLRSRARAKASRRAIVSRTVGPFTPDSFRADDPMCALFESQQTAETEPSEFCRETARVLEFLLLPGEGVTI